MFLLRFFDFRLSKTHKKLEIFIKYQNNSLFGLLFDPQNAAFSDKKLPRDPQGASQDNPRSPQEPPGSILEPPGVVLGASGIDFGASGVDFGASGIDLGPSGA